MKYIDVVKKIVKDIQKEYGRNNWSEAVRRLQVLYPTKKLTTEGVRSTYRRHGDTLVNPTTTQTKKLDYLAGRETLEDRLFPRIQRKTELSAIAKFLGVTEDDILLSVAKLQMNGFTRVRVWKEGNTTYIQNVRKAKEFGQLTSIVDKWKNTSKISIGVVSDTHLGSEYTNEEALNHFYDLMVERGIPVVLHAGDLSEGFKQTRVETFLGNKAIGFQQQVDYISKNYPKRDGVETLVISGNHDEWYMQQGLADIIKTVSMIRPDIKFLGNSYAKVLITPKIEITLFHPNDGSSANIFGKLQRFIERGGKKVSKINILGHYHKLAWIYKDDVHAFYAASFQRQSSWMNLNNLRSEIGGLILNLTVNTETGELLALNFEHIDYNDYNDYNEQT